MTRDEIIKLAREAGFHNSLDGSIKAPWAEGEDLTEELERFAALAVAAEREACAKVADQQYRVQEAVRAHAEGSLGGANHAYFVQVMTAIAGVGTAIRARSKA